LTLGTATIINEHGSQAPSISHVIPSRLLQILKSHCWNCNVSSDCWNFIQSNYVRNFGKQCHSSYNRSPADTKGHSHPQPGPINVARNSLATTSNFEVTLLELQRFQRLLKLHPIELRARFWKTVPQLIQQVARRHERPWPPGDAKGRGHPGNARSQASHGLVD